MLAASIAGASVRGSAAYQLYLKALLVFAAFALIAVWRKRVPGSYGLQRASGVHWRRTVAAGLALGAATSMLILLLGGSGMQAALGSMKFWQIVLTVWIGSSVSEEIFTRGWAQGALDRWRGVAYGGHSVPVIVAALLFGSMHATLIAHGVDLITTVLVVLSATLLGLIAGNLRERHGGLAPAVVVHICFNVGGAIGGLLYVLGYRLTTGKLPSLPS
jgi:membrane protease YdiL (CAAX protease family)